MSDKRHFQLNIKFDGGYDAPLLNIEGDDEQDFQRNVEFALSSADAIIDAAIVFQKGYALKKPKEEPANNGGGQRSQSWSNRGSQQSQQQTSSAPDGPSPECRHGAMKYVPAGFSQRTKKPYNAFWSCTGPRNEQCDTVAA